MANEENVSLRHRPSDVEDRICLSKPPYRRDRFIWAYEHFWRSIEQWNNVLWTDEIWVTEGQYRNAYVTRIKDEEFDPICIQEKIRKKKGWMFWRCFARKVKKPCLFWEKDWDSICQESYCEGTVPVIHEWLRINTHLQLIQDGAPEHAAGETNKEPASCGIKPVFWPALSPDLDPIETVWNKMKDYLQHHFGENLSYNQLGVAVRETWDFIDEKMLENLITGMWDWCAAVVRAGGMHVKY